VELVGRYSKQDPTGVAIDRIVVGLGTLPSERRREKGTHRLRHKLPQRLDPDTVNCLVTDYNAGVPTTQLTKRYGLGKGSVLRLLSDAGTTMRRQPMSDVQVDHAVQLYESGLSLTQVGDQLGIHSSTVWRALRARGVTMRSPNPPRADAHKTHNAEAATSNSTGILIIRPKKILPICSRESSR